MLAYGSAVRMEIPCGTSSELEAFLKEYKEVPMLRMISERNGSENVVIFFVNSSSGTYTIVEKISEDKFCMLNSGKNIKPYIKNDKSDTN